INEMAQKLEAYTEELQAQNEELQSQQEELQSQQEELLALNEELQAQRGGYTVIVNNQTLIGIVQGASFNGDYVAGGVSFNNDAFSNFTGLLAIAINTGLQSNALAGMSVTINVND
ncbi:MAG: hypothetical protein ACK40O_10690, partial [Allosphingosinicella sp.]